jgi:hypothetical protein
MVETFTVEPDLSFEEPFAVPAPPAGAPAPSRSLPRPRPRFRPRPGPARSRAVLPSAPALFPWLARGLSPGEVTLWCGPRLAVDPLLEALYAGSALARGQVSLLEGGNRFHPYRVGELGRSLGVDAGETLRRLRLARAFTAHQMVALVDGWAREVRRHRPTLLVGHDLPTLFWDGETPDDERDALLRRIARTLAAFLREVRLPLVLTLGPEGLASFPGLDGAGPRWADYVTFVRGPATFRLRSMRTDARLTLVARSPGQLGMEAFGGGSSAGEVTAWGARPRRTVRRSRNA